MDCEIFLCCAGCRGRFDGRLVLYMTWKVNSKLLFLDESLSRTGILELETRSLRSDLEALAPLSLIRVNESTCPCGTVYRLGGLEDDQMYPCSGE